MPRFLSPTLSLIVLFFLSFHLKAQVGDMANLTVNKLPQTLSFTVRTNQGTKTVTYGDAGFNGAATASSGLTMTYMSGNNAVASVDAAGVVTVVGAGTTTITASQSGDAIYLSIPDLHGQSRIDRVGCFHRFHGPRSLCGCGQFSDPAEHTHRRRKGYF